MARNGAIWMIGEKRQIGVCPVTSVAKFYFCAIPPRYIYY